MKFISVHEFQKLLVAAEVTIYQGDHKRWEKVRIEVAQDEGLNESSLFPNILDRGVRYVFISDMESLNREVKYVLDYAMEGANGGMKVWDVNFKV